MYTQIKISKLDFKSLYYIARILNLCGKDMAVKCDLHHWDNSLIKSFAIALCCSIKNDVFLVKENEMPVATYMTRIKDDGLYFEKLATHPNYSGKGIGSYCMDQIEKKAKDGNLKRVYMEVYQLSQNAISFYEHRGYKKNGITDTLKYKEVMMEKNI
ncbi:MAG: GNAT family N-acetyltransferase [Erysipelotrichaceae bacterium]|nr:GNAT family N-acetyltransferase [Erysipelotrichaceae bacterium]